MCSASTFRRPRPRRPSWTLPGACWSRGSHLPAHLTGKRTPHADPAARGGFVGATVRHTRAHCTRAVLEGVAFGMRDGLELMRTSGVAPPGEFRISGGGTRSALWRQLLADVLQVRLTTTATSEGAAFGAALLAAVAAGW